MFEGYSAETCAVKIPLASMSKGPPPPTSYYDILEVWGRFLNVNLKARTPIGDSRNLQTFLHTNLHIDLHTFLHTCLHTNLHTFGDTCLHTFLHTYLHI